MEPPTVDLESSRTERLEREGKVERLRKKFNLGWIYIRIFKHMVIVGGPWKESQDQEKGEVLTSV